MFIRKGRLLATLMVMLICMTLIVPTALASAEINFGDANVAGSRADNINCVVAGDLDGDGDLDIVTADEDDNVVAWENDGTPFSGGWNSNLVGQRSRDVNSVAVADFDRDGNLDIVSGDDDSDVIVWENDGTPFTGGWSPFVAGSSTDYILTVAVGDFNNNGKLDIISGDEDYKVIVWENDGSPFTGGWTSNVVGTVTQYVHSVVGADLNNNGDLDIVSALDGTGDDCYLTVWKNDGSPFSGVWDSNVVGNIATNRMETVAVGDLDGDGNLDIVSGDQSSPSANVTAWENDGSPFTGTWAPTIVGSCTDYVNWVAVGDLNCDGNPDIVSGDEDSMAFAWNNDGSPFSGGWTNTVVYNATPPTGEYLNTLALADLDGDSALDLICGTDEDNDVVVIENLADCTYVPVGGDIIPVSKVELLAPWIVLLLMVSGVTAVVIRRRMA